MLSLYPSLIVCPIDKIQNCISQTENYCAGYHIDIMDNKFVPNKSWDAQFVNSIRKLTNKQLFIHLMVEDPQKYIDLFELNQGDIISFHIETHDNPKDVIKKIHEKSLFASLALKPKTPIEKVIDYIHDIDHVLLMSVEPGFSGQEFLLPSFERFKALKAIKDINQEGFKIGLDGGINKTNIQTLNQLGADDVAIASAIFNHQDPQEAIKELYKLIQDSQDSLVARPE